MPNDFPIDPGFKRAMAQWQRELARSAIPIDDILSQIQTGFGGADWSKEVAKISQGVFSGAYEEMATAPTRGVTDALRGIELGAFKDLIDRIRAELPANWPDERGFSVAHVIDETRLPLIHAPRESVVEALCVAHENGSELGPVLLAHSDHILEDCVGQASATQEPELARVRSAVREACAAFPVAPMAAQALTAVATEAMMRLAFPTARSFRRFVQFLDDAADWEEASITWFRWALLCRCGLEALGEFHLSGDDPVPSTFNRHATVHTLDEVQYTHANALAAYSWQQRC